MSQNDFAYARVYILPQNFDVIFCGEMLILTCMISIFKNNLVICRFFLQIR